MKKLVSRRLYLRSSSLHGFVEWSSGGGGATGSESRDGGGGICGARAEVQQEGAEDASVHDASTLSGWHLEPKNESGLEGEIPGEVVKDDAKASTFEDVEEPKDTPVGEPLLVIFVSGRFQSLE